MKTNHFALTLAVAAAAALTSFILNAATGK
jgi:hypothetical protein